MSKADGTKVITGKNTRFSYCSVWEPKSNYGGEPRYSVSLLIPKSDTETVERIKSAIQEAYRAGESTLKGKSRTVPPLSEIYVPLRDGDTARSGDPSYAGCWFINAKSSTAPGIVDAARHPIRDRSEFYSGCYGRASVNFFAFNSNGNRGIACGLNHLQKLRDGDPLSGRASAEADFAGLDDDDNEDFLA